MCLEPARGKREGGFTACTVNMGGGELLHQVGRAECCTILGNGPIHRQLELQVHSPDSGSRGPVQETGGKGSWISHLFSG